MKYTHKSFLYDAEVAQEDGVVHTQYGDAFYSKGEILLKDKSDNVSVLSRDNFVKDYVPVEEVLPKEKGFAEMFANAYGEFEGLESSFEEEEYIAGTAEINGVRHTY